MVFSEPDQSEAHCCHTGVAEDRDGIVGVLELGLCIFGEAGTHV